MNFAEIDAERQSLNVSQYELCRAADINPSTYTRLLQLDTRQARGRTLRKLEAALSQFRRPEAAE